MGRKLTIDVTVRTNDNEHDVDGWTTIPAGTDEDELEEHIVVQLDDSAFDEDRTEELGGLEVARRQAEADKAARDAEAEQVASTPYDEKFQRPAFSEEDAAAQLADDPAMDVGPAAPPSTGALPRQGVEETIQANTDLSDEAAAALAESVPAAEDAAPIVVDEQADDAPPVTGADAVPPETPAGEIDVPNPSNPGTTPEVVGDDPTTPDLSHDPELNEAPNPDVAAEIPNDAGVTVPGESSENANPSTPPDEPTPVDVSGSIPTPDPAAGEPPVVVPPELIPEPGEPSTLPPADAQPTLDPSAPATELPPEGLPDPADVVTEAPAPDGPTKPLYVFDGDPADVAPPWTPTGLTNSDGRPLFTFEPDVAGGEATGDGAGGVWHAVATLPGTPPQDPAAAPPEPDGSNAAPAPDGTAQEATEPVSEPATGGEGPDLTEPPADPAAVSDAPAVVVPSEVPTEEQDPGQVADGGQVVGVVPAADATTIEP